MKTLLTTFLIFLYSFSHSQELTKRDSVVNFFRLHNIELNKLKPPKDFKVYYNCDSMLFMKAIFKDTIKIWTPGIEWFIELNEFEEKIKETDFGITEFAKSIDEDGRIYLSSYHQTEFIFKKDSLFQIELSNEDSLIPTSDLLTRFINDKIEKKEFEKQIDSIKKINDSISIYRPKLIFSSKIFKKKGDKLKLPKKLNFLMDTIILEDKWIKNGKTFYVIRINNKLKSGEETSYSFSFDQDYNFFSWENCLN